MRGIALASPSGAVALVNNSSWYEEVRFAPRAGTHFLPASEMLEHWRKLPCGQRKEESHGAFRRGIRGTWFYSRVGPQPLDCAGKRVKRTSEHHARHQGRMGGPQIGPPRAERPRPVPMVLSGSTSRTVYILLGILRSRVETTHPARLSSRTGIGARPGHLRPLRDRYDRGGAAASLFARPSARCPIGRVGPGETHAQEPLGCRPHPARGRGRRRVRPR